MNELETIDHVLRGLVFPEGVVDWELRMGNDHMDYPAVWISLVIDSAVWTEAWSRTHGTRIRRTIHDALREAGIDRWPYVWILTTEEREKDLQGTPAR